MTEEQRQALIQALGQLMSDWSEEWYAAGWMSGLEDMLPTLIREIVTYPKSRSKSQLAEARAMWEIAKKLGHWVKWADGQYVPHLLDFYWPQESNKS